MSDLVERLRKYGKHTEAHEAADRIEALETENADLRARIEYHLEMIARAAGAPEQD